MFQQHNICHTNDESSSLLDSPLAYTFLANNFLQLSNVLAGQNTSYPQWRDGLLISDAVLNSLMLDSSAIHISQVGTSNNISASNSVYYKDKFQIVPPSSSSFSNIVDQNVTNKNNISTLYGNTNKPYCLTLNYDKSNINNKKIIPNSYKHGKDKNITAETYVSMHRPQPAFAVQTGKLSMYSHWQQVSVNDNESRMNLKFMSMCATRPRIGVKSYWRYTTASRESGHFRMTHSSYWNSRARRRRESQIECQPQIKNSPDILFLQPSVNDSNKDNCVTESDSSNKPIITNVEKSDSTEEEVIEKKRKKIENKIFSTDSLTGHRTDEVYVYVRGRGRGRYVCDRCGIRCKKPSMLKKHLKSHTDIRPFKCTDCNFSFKTKGNLTKHLSSKTHLRRVNYENEGDSSFSVDTKDKNAIEFDDIDMGSSDEEGEELNTPTHAYKFGQENILLERSVHTPPTKWMLFEEKNKANSLWPVSDVFERNCSTAPPASMQRENDEKSAVTNTHHLNEHGSGRLLVDQCLTQPIHSLCYLNNEENYICNQCSRPFRKASDLTLHQHTHNIEKKINRNKLFHCTNCGISYRRKISLKKHMETTHMMGTSFLSNSLDTMEETGDSSDDKNNLKNNSRTFICSDCNIGFRKHGILAKHLRSKTHIMKLETLKRLPCDTLSLIIKNNHGACLNDVDTTDCDKARMSLLSIVESLKEEGLAKGLSELPKIAHSSSGNQRSVSVIIPKVIVPVATRTGYEEFNNEPSNNNGNRVKIMNERKETSTTLPRISKNACSICQQQFETAVMLKVHLQIDHFTMMDGNEYRCPRRYCDKLFSCKMTLKNHIIMHYQNDDSTSMREMAGVANSQE